MLEESGWPARTKVMAVQEVGELKRDRLRASQPAPVGRRSPAATLALPGLQCATMSRASQGPAGASCIGADLRAVQMLR